MQITAFKAILARRMSKQGCEYYVRSEIPNFVDSQLELQSHFSSSTGVHYHSSGLLYVPCKELNVCFQAWTLTSAIFVLFQWAPVGVQ